jgi:hypothetical protein
MGKNISSFKKIIFVFMVIGPLVFAGCTRTRTFGPAAPDTGGNTSGDRTLSGNVYSDNALTAGIGGVSLDVYEVDSTGAWVGPIVASATSASDGSFSLTVPDSKNYDIEVYKAGDPSDYSFYLPYTDADKSGIKLGYSPMSGVGLVTGGMAEIFHMSSFIQATDQITIDGGSNFNNTTISSGNSYALVIANIFGIDMGNLHDYLVAASSFPGTQHTLSFNGSSRTIRVQAASSYHAAMALYY